jgi:hypothetical protein
MAAGCRDEINYSYGLSEVTVVKKLVFLLFTLAIAVPCWSAEKIKSVTITVENPVNTARPAADVIVPIEDLRKIAPDFMPGSLRVTCASADGTEGTQELPSQVDDLDGDNKADELAFQIDLAPRQTRTVTIQYGEPDQIYRLRKDYPQRTYALFSTKIEGVGWESENIAFRVYFDPRNAIDIYGKRRRSLQLRMYATPEYPYHQESPEGRDIFKVGESIGIGAVGAWVDGKVVRAADVKERSWRIISLGPVRTIVQLEYRGWNLGEKSIVARSRISMWAGEHGFYHAITVEPQGTVSLVTGLPVKSDIPLTKSASAKKGSVAWLATWGEQVVAPGPTATEAIAGQNLGLAIVSANEQVEFADDSANHLMRFATQSGEVSWYAMAAWDQEKAGRNQFAAAANSKDAFVKMVKDEAERISQPVKVRVLTGARAE